MYFMTANIASCMVIEALLVFCKISPFFLCRRLNVLNRSTVQMEEILNSPKVSEKGDKEFRYLTCIKKRRGVLYQYPHTWRAMCRKWPVMASLMHCHLSFFSPTHTLSLGRAAQTYRHFSVCKTLNKGLSP